MQHVNPGTFKNKSAVAALIFQPTLRKSEIIRFTSWGQCFLPLLLFNALAFITLLCIQHFQECGMPVSPTACSGFSPWCLLHYWTQQGCGVWRMESQCMTWDTGTQPSQKCWRERLKLHSWNGPLVAYMGCWRCEYITFSFKQLTGLLKT